ncbi:MAG TPA: cytochrome c3 family protein, partial [Phenylobacterium sp.]|nr:cytochrome c3 family protein [Phenylobacterium sp.]
DRQRPGTIRPTAFAASGASAYRATFSPGGACYDCHTISWEGDTVRMAPVKLANRYLPRGGFDHSVPEHGGPGQSKAGGFKCADCHRAEMSDKTSDVLIPDIAKCGTCHGKTTAQIRAADDADCTTCHSFHAPGKATPKPGHPPLQTLRWTEAMSRRAAGA